MYLMEFFMAFPVQIMRNQTQMKSSVTSFQNQNLRKRSNGAKTGQRLVKRGIIVDSFVIFVISTNQ